MTGKTLKSILWSRDLGVALLIAGVAHFYLPREISNAFAKDVYRAGLSTLSIVFSVYFAGLAIIISSSHDEFVRWLEKFGVYLELTRRFQCTLWILFFALLLSLGVFTYTSYSERCAPYTQPKFLFTAFCFFTLHALLATLAAANASIRYAQFRARYVKLQQPSECSGENNPEGSAEDRKPPPHEEDCRNG